MGLHPRLTGETNGRAGSEANALQLQQRVAPRANGVELHTAPSAHAPHPPQKKTHPFSTGWAVPRTEKEKPQLFWSQSDSGSLQGSFSHNASVQNGLRAAEVFSGILGSKTMLDYNTLQSIK